MTMVSTQKEFVYLHELPFIIEKRAKEGYAHFRIDFLDTKKTRRERVQVRFWRDSHPAKRFECPNCGEMFNNRINLRAHTDKENRAPTENQAVLRKS